MFNECQRCGFSGHSKSDCVTIQCSKCRGFGHRQRDCATIACKSCGILGHTSREWLDQIGGKSIETGSMWKAYGWQWRQWGLPYLGMEVSYRELRKALRYSVGSNERIIKLEQLAHKHPIIYKHLDLLHRIEIVDQLSDILYTLRSNPTSRRIVLSAWNAGELNEMCLGRDKTVDNVQPF